MLDVKAWAVASGACRAFREVQLKEIDVNYVSGDFMLMVKS